MEHPLAMDAEAMRRAGYATVDALVARLADPGADPVLRRAGAAEMRARLGGPPPEQAGDYGAVLARVIDDVLPYASRTDHPGYFAFIPSFTTWPAALAELTAAAANPYCGAWMEAAAAAQVELEVIDWFRTWLGMPTSTAGLLVGGGSAANLTALLVAREAAGGASGRTVMYVSDQAHSSLARTARAMGLRPHQVRVLPTDDHWRLSPETVAAAVRSDRRAGRVPFALCASAGSTNAGAVDPLNDLADVCAGEELWLHVNAAYGGFAALTAKGRALLAGAERADSVTLDPHKWLFQPMECGSVLIRDGARLERTFAIHPDYLDGNDSHGEGEVNFADRGLQLSRGFRALKIWMSVHTFGLAAFRAAIQRNLELAEFAEALVRSHAELTLMAPATLGIVCFRREWPGADEAETERRGTALIDALESTGTALVSSTRLAWPPRRPAVYPQPDQLGRARTAGHRALRRRAGLTGRAACRGGPHRFPGRRRGRPGRRRAAHHVLAVRRGRLDRPGRPCPRRLSRHRRRGGGHPPMGLGPVLLYRPVRPVRRRHRRPPDPDRRPGDHFGELAARDWGGGYGYARLATVRCAEPGRLLKLTSEDFQWLVDTEPAVKARLATILAERLQQR